MNYEKNKPTKKELSWYSAYKPLIKQENGNGNWYMQWTKESIKQYYLEGLLLHEIGHKMDSIYKRYWSQAYSKRAEQFADNYAFYWGDKIRNEFS